MNGPNKLKCYITLGWKSLTVTNTLAYWAHSCVTNKIKCSEYDSWCFLQKPTIGSDISNKSLKRKHKHQRRLQFNQRVKRAF
jgi:hypothetical protein